MKKKVVITDYTYENIDIERRILTSVGADLQDYQYREEYDVIKVAKDCDVLIVQYSKITRKVIEKLSNCKAIVRYAIGVDNIDLDAATEKGIYVVNVPDYGVDEVGTYAVTLLLAAARKLPQTIKSIEKKQWDYSQLKPLYRTYGKKVGLIGFGKIPQDVAKKLSGFGFEIVAYDPYLDTETIKQHNVIPIDLDELIETSDYISIHSPLTNETKNMFTLAELKRMKPTSYLINTARGGIVNEEDLYTACKENIIAGAALDVVKKEPIDKNHPLLELENVIITPHMAWYTEESIEALKKSVAEEAARVLNGEIPKHVVNKKVLVK